MPSPYTLVSVVMNCRNSAEFLADAIASVYAQSMDQWEIVFFDNQSTDESPAIAHSFDGRLRYFRSHAPLSLGAARNRALAKARGDYVAFLDCDDLWHPEKLGLQVEAFQSRGRRAIGLVFTDTVRINSEGEALMSFAHERSTPADGDMFAALLEDCFMALSSCMVPRELVSSLGGIDERLSFVEEWDLWLRIARDYDVRRVPGELTSVRFHDGNTSRDFRAQRVEVLALLKSVSLASAEHERARRRGLDRFRLRYSILAVAEANWRQPSALIRSMLAAVAIGLRRPRISLEMVRRYFRPGMLRLLSYKYLARPPGGGRAASAGPR